MALQQSSGCGVRAGGRASRFTEGPAVGTPRAFGRVVRLSAPPQDFLETWLTRVATWFTLYLSTDERNPR
jgi:hypothetical protein